MESSLGRMSCIPALFTSPFMFSLPGFQSELLKSILAKFWPSVLKAITVWSMLISLNILTFTQTSSRSCIVTVIICTTIARKQLTHHSQTQTCAQVFCIPAHVHLNVVHCYCHCHHQCSAPVSQVVSNLDQ